MSLLRISTDKAELDLPLIHRFLSTQAYWSRGIPEETVARAVAGTLCFGGYIEGVGQVAFARVVSDFATFAYLADVFVLDGHRGQGLSKWLMEVILAHPELQGLRRWVLVTRDAHGLYERFGFGPPANPAGVMTRLRASV